MSLRMGHATGGLPLASNAQFLEQQFPALHIKNVPLLWGLGPQTCTGFVAEILLWLQQGMLTLTEDVPREF